MLSGRARSAIGRILTGSVLGQGLVLAVSPFLARIYSPSDFSALALLTAFVAVLSSVVTLSWERAVVLPSSDREGWQIVRLGIVSTCGMSLVVCALALAFRKPLTELFGSTLFISYWWLIPATTLVTGLYVVLSSWIVRAQEYGRLSVRNVVVGVGQATISLGCGVLGFVPIGLLASLGAGRLVGLIGLARGRPSGGLRTGWDGTRSLISAYRKFPLITSWSRALNSLGLQLPMILLIALYGSFEAGFVALTIRVLASPVGIVVDAVGQYFDGAAAEIVRSGQATLRRLVVQLTRSLLIVGSGPAILVILFGGPLFAVVFGSEWEPAGGIAQILAGVYLLQFVVVPVSSSLLLLQHQATQMMWDLGRMVATGGAVILASALGFGLQGAVVAYGVAQGVLYSILFILVYSRTARWDHRLPASR